MGFTISTSIMNKISSLKKVLKRLRAIEDISCVCSTIFTYDLIAASHKILKPFCELTGADYGLVFLLRSPDKQLYVEATYGLPEEYREVCNKKKILTLSSENIPENWPSIRSMLKKQIVIIKELHHTNVSFSKYFIDLIKPNKIRTVAAIPIVINDKAVGAITQYFIKSHAFDNEELSFMKTTANLITSTIERNCLLEAARKSEKELAQANEILKHVNQELDSFAYIASHDLREPLRTIESFVSIIQDKLPTNIEQQDYLSRIIKATKRMRRLIQDLTVLSRASRDKKEDENEVVDLNDLLMEVQFELTAFIQCKNAKIVFPDNLPLISGNKEKIASVFKNLIVNGVKFNKSKEPEVQIKIVRKEEIDSEKLSICIEDNGIGIEKEYHKKIFGLFQRLHTQEEYEGTGAGLAIVKKILEKYNCEIWLESEKGKGSKFFFTLIKAKSEGQPAFSFESLTSNSSFVTAKTK